MKVNGHDFSREDLRKALVLYAITDRGWLKPGEKLTDKVREALEGGATMIQLREKDLDEARMEEEAAEIRKLCSAFDVPFLLDDDVELAVSLNCDGVHVGQSDMEAGRVREIIGPDRILGVSVGTVEEAVRAEKQGADYIGAGAVFHTGTKKNAEDITHETFREICKAVSIPVVAIGGIARENVAQLSGLGSAGISVISAVFGAPDIREATADLKKRTLEMLQA